MRFDANYRERVTLKDGRQVILRLLRPSDRPRLVAGFTQLSDEGRYRRFLSAKARLSKAELDYLTDVDQQTHVAIGAIAARDDNDEDGDEGLAVARFIQSHEDPRVADTAIAVTDNAQGIGLGTVLFHRLAEAASERGIERFRGEILANNEAMLAITRGLADELTPRVSEGIATVEFALPTPPSEPPDAARERQRSLLRWFASDAAAVRRFLAWHRGSDEEE